jgi:hypothetical protein
MKIRDLHRRAMACADEAFLAGMNNEDDRARELWRQAFELEREAALSAEAEKLGEPTRSILLRSAASLALDCSELREAERLIAAALAGNPPEEIAEELRALYQQVNARRTKKTGRSASGLPGLLDQLKHLTPLEESALVKALAVTLDISVANAKVLKQKLIEAGAPLEVKRPRVR